MNNLLRRYELLLAALLGAFCGVLLLMGLVLVYEEYQTFFSALDN